MLDYFVYEQIFLAHDVRLCLEQQSGYNILYTVSSRDVGTVCVHYNARTMSSTTVHFGYVTLCTNAYRCAALS